MIVPGRIWKAVLTRWPKYRGASGFGSVGVYRRELIKKGLLTTKATLTKKGREYLSKLENPEKVQEGAA